MMAHRLPLTRAPPQHGSGVCSHNEREDVSARGACREGHEACCLHCSMYMKSSASADCYVVRTIEPGCNLCCVRRSIGVIVSARGTRDLPLSVRLQPGNFGPLDQICQSAVRRPLRTQLNIASNHPSTIVSFQVGSQSVRSAAFVFELQLLDPHLHTLVPHILFPSEKTHASQYGTVERKHNPQRTGKQRSRVSR